MADATIPPPAEAKANLETAASAAEFDIAQALKAASRETGRSPVSLSLDYAKASLGKARLSHDEFFRYKIYDKSHLSAAERAAFVGQRPSNLLNTGINEAKSLRHVIDDKVLYAAMLRGMGINAPSLQAALWTDGAETAFPIYRDAAAFAQFLRTEARYPLFGKPRDGSESKGSASFDSYDEARDRLVSVRGKEVDPDVFAAEAMQKFGAGGYIVQDRVVPHPALQEVSGHAVGTVRIFTLDEGDGPEPRYAVWKIPAFNGIADNLWRKGNLIAEVDVKTGEVLAVRRGGVDGRTTFDTHPESGAQLVGRILPDWADALALVQRAASLTPHVLGIGFDLALSDKGPLVIEANTRPAHGLYQSATGRGFLSPEMREAVERATAHAKDIVASHRDGVRADAKSFTKTRQKALKASITEGRQTARAVQD